MAMAMSIARPAHALESASDYPSKPVRIVVTFSTGGPADLMAREIGQKLSEAWGQPVIIDNRPGAGGTIGTNLVAKSAPDGYTLVMSSLGPMASAPYVYSHLPYDPIKDLAPITEAAASWLFLVVNPSMDVHSVQDLIALAKEKPGQITVASSGIATPSHLAAASFQSVTGVRLSHIPYKGGSESITAVVSGHVQMALETPGPIVPQVKAGTLRALLVAGPTRSPLLPDVPTAAQAGLPALQVGSWYGFHAPAGTPQPVIDKIHDAIVKVIQTPEMQGHLAALGAEARTGTPAEYGDFVASEMKKWEKIVREAGIKAD